MHKKDASRVAAELAILYELGRNFERAADWFLQAARNAAAVYANHEAGELCRRAISVAGRLPDAQRSALVLDAAMLRAELHLNVSDFESAVADFGSLRRQRRMRDWPKHKSTPSVARLSRSSISNELPKRARSA
jgi:hypothetical protein